MTTDKTRCTVYFYDTRPLDDLVELARRASPLEDRGRITRSTCVEAAVALALEDLRANGAQSAVLAALVALPRAQPGDLEPSQLLDDWRAAGERLGVPDGQQQNSPALVAGLVW